MTFGGNCSLYHCHSFDFHNVPAILTGVVLAGSLQWRTTQCGAGDDTNFLHGVTTQPGITLLFRTAQDCDAFRHKAAMHWNGVPASALQKSESAEISSPVQILFLRSSPLLNTTARGAGRCHIQDRHFVTFTCKLSCNHKNVLLEHPLPHPVRCPLSF